MVVLSGYPHWEGGYALGSRYLLPASFFAALGLPFSIRKPWSQWLFVAASAFSVTNFFLLTASWPHIPPSIRWPVANVAWWSLTHGWAAPNLGSLVGLRPLWCLAIPGMAFASALCFAMGLRLGRSGTGILAICIGVFALALSILVAPPIAPTDAAWRAWLFQFLQS
jgi:hypothetical protein